MRTASLLEKCPAVAEGATPIAPQSQAGTTLQKGCIFATRQIFAQLQKEILVIVSQKVKNAQKEVYIDKKILLFQKPCVIVYNHTKKKRKLTAWR